MLSLHTIAHVDLKTFFTGIFMLLVIFNHTYVGDCQSLCLTGTYLGTLADGSKDCLFCSEKCRAGFVKVEDCQAERDIKCQKKCSDGEFYNRTDKTCRNCSTCTDTTVKNCTLLKDTVCENVTEPKKNDEKDDSPSIIIMVAGVAGAFVAVVVIIVPFLWVCKLRRRKNLKSQTVEKKSESQTSCEDGANISLLNGKQSPKTVNSTITETGNTTKESKEEIMNNVNGSKKDNAPEINHSSEQVPPEQNSNQSTGILKTAVGYALKNFASNDYTTTSQLGRF